MFLPKDAQIVRMQRPNRHCVSLVQYVPGDEQSYSVIVELSLGEGEVDETELECDDRAEADIVFDREVKELRDKPNWQAQAEYDDAHGTDNGYTYYPGASEH